jgi:hypothetical protein
MTIDRLTAGLMALAVAALAPSMLSLHQPIVENYVGRQVPTAMVARNLERGGSLLRPELDTGPFPSLFAVEPPVYAGLVALVARGTGLPVGAAGRLTSTLASALGAAAIAGLIGRRRGRHEGWLAAALFLWLPVTLRYGRAVQPDMLALGLLTAGLDAWERWARGGRPTAALIGWLAASVGIACRILWTFAWLPIGLVLFGQRTLRRQPAGVVLVLLTLIGPALAWYALVWRAGTGSAAARATAADWLAAIGPGGLFRAESWRWIAWFGCVRAFTPVAWVLVGGCLMRGVLDPLWTAWLLGSVATLALVSGKLHHEYYWLMVAPAVAAGMACWVAREFEAARMEGRRPWFPIGVVGLQVGLSIALASSTWRTPAEWARISDLPGAVAELPPGARMIGREAVLYHADRRGMRLETEPAALGRALAEWGVETAEEEATPRAALNWYHRLGARSFAEVADPSSGRIRSEWAEAAREASARVLADEAGLLVIELRDELHE